MLLGCLSFQESEHYFYSPGLILISAKNSSGLLGLNFFSIFVSIQTTMMKEKDERMKATTEILNGIKYIKMSGWENIFLEKVK